MMFGFNNKDNLRQEATPKINYNARNRLDEINAWLDSEEHKRFVHLKTLIIKTYETVDIKVDIIGEEISEEFTRADLIQDFAVFFKPEVFDKLICWCEEYVIGKKLNNKALYGEE